MNLRKIFTTVSVLMTVACATPANIKKETAPNKTDKFESWNRQMLSFNEDVDNAILKPMAKGYMSATSTDVEKA